jgi:hypothetical protein
VNDLLLGAPRPDEKFHVQVRQPRFEKKTWFGGFIRKTFWYMLLLPDGSPGTFVSWWIWNLQWYFGTTKCDGTRTYMLNHGELGEPESGYVMTTTPSELHAFRWRSGGPSFAYWDNMGGS